MPRTASGKLALWGVIAILVGLAIVIFIAYFVVTAHPS